MCSRLKDCTKPEQLAEKRSFEGNCEILAPIFQPRALSSNIPFVSHCPKKSDDRCQIGRGILADIRRPHH